MSQREWNRLRLHLAANPDDNFAALRLRRELDLAHAEALALEARRVRQEAKDVKRRAKERA